LGRTGLLGIVGIAFVLSRKAFKSSRDPLSPAVEERAAGVRTAEAVGFFIGG